MAILSMAAIQDCSLYQKRPGLHITASFSKQKNPRTKDGAQLVESNVQLSLGLVLRPHKSRCGGISL